MIRGTRIMTSSVKRMYHSGSRISARVLLTDGVDECCINLFKERGHQVDFLNSMPEAELIKIIGSYEGLVVRSATKVNANVLQHATKMRVVGRAGVGVDNIDITEATKRGIMVMNTPGGNTVSTAQLAVSLIACLARKVPAADMSVKEGKWDRLEMPLLQPLLSFSMLMAPVARLRKSYILSLSFGYMCSLQSDYDTQIVLIKQSIISPPS